MSTIKFIDITKLSTKEIAEKIVATENELFQLNFKKATRQAFKSHEIKSLKRLIAQLKTLLTVRLKAEIREERRIRNSLILNEN
jgi:ribosomal protein L29